MSGWYLCCLYRLHDSFAVITMQQCSSHPLQASLSMDEAARQTSSHSLSSASSYTSATMRRPGASQRQHRRTGSVGTVSEHEVEYFVLKKCTAKLDNKKANDSFSWPLTSFLLFFLHYRQARSIIHSSRSSVTSASGISVNSASSMDSLDSVLHSSEADGPQVSVPAEAAAPGHHITEVTSQLPVFEMQFIIEDIIPPSTFIFPVILNIVREQFVFNFPSKIVCRIWVD